MSVTTSERQTLAVVLDRANPNQVSDALALVKLATMLNPVKITLTGITADASVDITAFLKGDSTLTIDSGLAGLATGEALPPILMVKTCRVTTSGTAGTVGSYVMTDAGGTGVTAATSAVAGLALLSDDGTTITFTTTITGMVLEYIPRSDTTFSTLFAPLPA